MQTKGPPGKTGATPHPSGCACCLLPQGEKGLFVPGVLPTTTLRALDAQFLQQARKMAITPISEKALEETTLTPREQLIISRVRDGWTNKEIADELTTIKKHLTELYKKFHVHSRTQLLLEIDKSRK